MKRKNEAYWSESQQRWQINVQTDGDRRTFVSSKANSKPDSKKGKIEAERKADKWLGSRLTDENTKVNVLLDSFAASLKERTGTGYCKQFDNYSEHYIKPVIGTKKIGSLTAGDLQSVIDKAYSGGRLSRKSLSNIRGFLSSWLKYCRLNNYTKLFAEDLSIPASAKRSTKTILSQESLEILFSVDTTEFRTVQKPDSFIWAYRFAVVTGLRPGELTGLLNANMKGDILSITQSINEYGEVTQGKNDNARRTIELSETAKWILDNQKQMLLNLGIISKYVFPDNDGCNITLQRFRKRWKRYCLVNGIETANSPYELRHTFVSVNDTMPDALKKMVMGHSKNMDTEGVYGHEKKGDMIKAAGYIDAAFAAYLPKEK